MPTPPVPPTEASPLVQNPQDSIHNPSSSTLQSQTNSIKRARPSDDESEDDEDTSSDESENDAPTESTPVTAAVLDDDLEVTGGTVISNPAPVTTLLPYPAPGELRIQPVNPLLETLDLCFAPTLNLPHELQAWWQHYAHEYVAGSDPKLWVMVTVISDPRRLSTYEIINACLSNWVNYTGIILGPGQSRFALVRFKSTIAKNRFKSVDKLEKGVYLHFTGQIRTSLLIYQLETVPQILPPNVSLILTASGLPFHLHYRTNATEVHGGLWSQTPNDKYMITQIRDLDDRPLIAYAGSRVYEVTFKREAYERWIKLLSQ
ncbi:hypothetical protein DFH28DRAFT_920642, partial [Melampsora americana]